MPKAMDTAVAAKRIDFVTMGLMAGWALTLITIVWQVAIKDATYTSRLDEIESDLNKLDRRVDTAEQFRLEISSDLAEIKTDLVWIRLTLQDNASNIEAIRNAKD